MNVSGRQIVGNHSSRTVFVHHQIEHIELVVKLDTQLDAVLVERLQNHVSGTVGCVARASNRGFSVVTGVSTEPALVDLAVWSAVERKTHVFQINYRLNRLFGEDFSCVLIYQVVATLNGVEGVPLPVVFLHVCKRSRHSTLRGSSVRSGWEQFRNHCHPGMRSSLDCGTHSRSTGTNNHDVVLVVDYLGFRH